MFPTRIFPFPVEFLPSHDSQLVVQEFWFCVQTLSESLNSPKSCHSAYLARSAAAILSFISAGSRRPPTFHCTAPAYPVAIARSLISVALHILSISGDLIPFARRFYLFPLIVPLFELLFPESEYLRPK